MITIDLSQIKNKLIFIVALAAVILLIVGFTNANIAGAKVKICDGTYLVDLGQSEAFWTFSTDGTFQSTDSAEVFLGFSHAQGAWRSTGERTVKATWLDFLFDPNAGTPSGYGRVDANIGFGSDCETFSGTLDLRIYASSEDPLDPTGTSPVIIGLPYTGRRISP